MIKDAKYFGLYIGLQLSESDLRSLEIAIKMPIKMPCGFVIVPPETGFVKDADVRCPCGDKNHYVVIWTHETPYDTSEERK